MLVFRDRPDAGRRLAARLLRFAPSGPLVLGLPRGGVVVAREVALALRAPLDILPVRKVGAPAQPELGIGAVAPDGILVVNPDMVRRLGVAPAELDEIVARERAELERRRRAYGGDRPPPDPRGRVVILVDDGIATGHTAIAAARWARAHGAARVVVAAPVAAADSARRLASEADEVVAEGFPEELVAVGGYYERFDQVTDAEVRAALG
jgi:predicted phosphoribosyltransferase